MIDEDNPPNERRTLPPTEYVDARMVALSLSSMATTLEAIQQSVAEVPKIARAVEILERQHESTLRAIGEAKGAANLAGSMAARALEEIQEVKVLVGRLAQSTQGLEEASRSLYESVFPERVSDSPSTPPDIELADVVPIRRHVMTGE